MNSPLTRFAVAFAIATAPACTTDMGVPAPLPDYCFPKDKAIDASASTVFDQQCFDPAYREKFLFKEVRKVALAVHILLYNGVSVDDVKAGIRRDIAAMNSAFMPMGLQFYVGVTEEIYDDGVKAYFDDDITPQECLDIHNAYITPRPNRKDALSIYYIPKCDNRWDGATPIGNPPSTMFYHHPLKHFPSDDMYPAKNGYIGHPYWLAHEIGHRYGLMHPFSTAEVGDGIDETIDYYRTCSNNPDEFPHNKSYIEKTVQNGSCMVSCAGGCFVKPSNIMDYNWCGPDIPSVFTQEQFEVMQCTIQSQPKRFADGIDSGLPEVDF